VCNEHKLIAKRLHSLLWNTLSKVVRVKVIRGPL
jgi:hypothetical protein